MLKKTVLVHALALAFGGTALTLAVMQPASAQSNAAGTAYGRVASGAATSVVIRNTDTNQQRTVQVDASGAFSASALQPGHYRATLQGGSMNGRTSDIDVIAGQGSEFVFAVGDTARVEVTGRRSRIDVSNATNGATFTSRELEKLPVAHNVDAIIQLAPNTTRSDPTYAGGHSIGGGAPSENAYYINGFPVTNPLTQLGGAELPFGAVATAEIKTGGYGAEFGRSVGGVVNVTGKSGTNTWEFGADAIEVPSSMRARTKDMYYPANGVLINRKNPSLGTYDNKLRIRNSEDTSAQHQVGAYVGGPIIQDKLFMFVAGERTTTNSAGVTGSAFGTTNAVNGWQTVHTDLDRYYTKFDFNITDNHRLEYTSFGDVPDQTSSYHSYDYTTHAVGSAATSTVHTKNDLANGTEAQLLRYTGNLTDNFTITSMYGISKATHIYEPAGYNPDLPIVQATTDTQYPGLNYTSGQSFGDITKSGANDQVKSFRIDLEYKLGQHTIKAGIDNNKMQAFGAGDLYAGGALYTYGHTTDPNSPIPVSGGTVPAMAGYGPLAAQGYYVEKTIYSNVSNAYAGQTAQYIEDSWQVTKNVLVKLGVRNEGFYNANQDGTKYIDQKNSILPRVSAVWDVNGDASLKLFGSAGRYSVPMPTSVALRGANGSLNTNQYFAYTGTDANGVPTGLTPMTGVLSANNEYGQAKDPKTLAAIDMKPSYQDEITLGFEQAFSPNLNFGGKFTYRTLKSTIDDFCDQRPFDKYAAAHNIDESNWGGFACASFNPGEPNSFYVDYSGTQSNYTRVNFSAADLGFEKAERKYMAVDLFLEHPYRNGWYGKVNYTWSRDKGNTEGQTLSDPNGAQTDVAATMAWDYPEIMVGANGLLPEDRTHQIKAFGWYDLTQEWTIGGNLDVESGRPKGCLGTNPSPNADSPNYLGYEHYCGGTVYTQNVLTPRGTLGRLPWTKTLDMNLAYKPMFLKGLNLKLDVFNVFNDQTMIKRLEQWNSGTNRSSTYGGAYYYQTPRYARFTAEYNHKF